MLNRLVTAPDGVEWIVGRAFLFGPPRYIGFRFGRDRAGFEPARRRRVPVTSRPPVSPTAVVSPAPIDWAASDPEPATAASESTSGRRRRYRHRGGTLFLPSRSFGGSSWSGGSSGSAGAAGGSAGSGSSWARSGGGGSRSFAAAAATGSSFGRSGSGSSSGKGKGGGAAGGLAGLGALLIKVARIALIVVAVLVALWLTIFVLIPALIFALWGLLIALAIARHAVLRQPWIVEAKENRPAPNVRRWAVQGWRESRAVVDQVAEAIADGTEPQPPLATPVPVG